jgi:hypothetical protein
MVTSLDHEFMSYTCPPFTCRNRAVEQDTASLTHPAVTVSHRRPRLMRSLFFHTIHRIHFLQVIFPRGLPFTHPLLPSPNPCLLSHPPPPPPHLPSPQNATTYLLVHHLTPRPECDDVVLVSSPLAFDAVALFSPRALHSRPGGPLHVPV